MSLLGLARRAFAGSALEGALRASGIGPRLLAAHERRTFARGRLDVRAYGERLCFLARSKAELTRVEMIGRAERAFVERLLARLRAGDVFWDIGANIGVLSVLAARRLEGVGGGRVVAVEPDPEALATLSRNLELNGVRAQRVAAALADDDGRGLLLTGGDAAIGTQRLARPDQDGGPAVPVPLLRGDELARRLGVAPTLIKIDVEGAELGVLRGLRGLLGRGLPRELFIEVHPPLLHARRETVGGLFDELAGFGYVPCWTRPRGSEIHVHCGRMDAPAAAGGPSWT